MIARSKATVTDLRNAVDALIHNRKVPLIVTMGSTNGLLPTRLLKEVV